MMDRAQNPSKASPVLKPVYYFYGEEDLLMEDAVEDMKAGALTGGMASLNFQVFSKGNLDANAIISAAMTMPAFSDKRVVLVKDADALKAADVKLLIDYNTNPSPFTCLIFVSNSSKIDKKSEFIKLLEKSGGLRAFGRLGDRELAAWVKKAVNREKKEISDAAASRLAGLSGGKLRDLKAELEKMFLFTADKAAIDISDVEDSGLDCREETLFGLSDAIGSKDVKTAMRIYAKVSNEPPQMILGAIARQMRILLKIKALECSGADRFSMAGRLGIFPAHFDGYQRRSRLFSEQELKTAITRLRGVDVVLKTGRMSERTAMSGLIMSLCGAGR